MADIKKAAAAAKPVAKAVAATKPAEAKVEEKKVEEKKVEAKKAVEEKKAAPAKKAAAPKKKAAPAKKEAAVKAATKVSVNLQFAGKEYKAEDFEKMAKDVWQYDLGKKAADLKSVDLYVKPEENKVYYVMNGDVTGDFDI